MDAATGIEEESEAAPRIGRILIAQGRDAADVPLTHTFGPGTLLEFRVWADEVPPDFATV